MATPSLRQFMQSTHWQQPPADVTLPSHNERWLWVNIDNQRLYAMRGLLPQDDWPISTGLNGVGEHEGSGCTPRGWHRIAERIGDDEPLNAVFVARQPTGEVYTARLNAEHPARDWILTRILWLDGLEPAFNQGSRAIKGQTLSCDTKSRYIYLHGTPETEPMGIPQSHGCIRLHSPDMLNVFAASRPNMLVLITHNLPEAAT